MTTLTQLDIPIKEEREVVNVTTITAEEIRDYFGTQWEITEVAEDGTAIITEVPYMTSHKGVDRIFDITPDCTKGAEEHAKDLIQREINGRIEHLEVILNKFRNKRLEFLGKLGLETYKAYPEIMDEHRKTWCKLLTIKREGFKVSFIPLEGEFCIRPRFELGHSVFKMETSVKCHTDEAVSLFEIEEFKITDVTLYDHRGTTYSSAKNEYLDFLLHYRYENEKTSDGFNLDRHFNECLDEIDTGYYNTLFFTSREAAEKKRKELLDRLQSKIDDQLAA